MQKSLASLSLALSTALLMFATRLPSVAQSTSDDEARLIAQEAYIYAHHDGRDAEASRQ